MKADSFTCPKCERTSHNPMDVHEQYCGACHEWFNDFGPMHYDRAGNTISLGTWVTLRQDQSYSQLAETYVGRTRVSTIWLGVDQGFLSDTPIIFETMVFARYGNLGQWRYPTERKALIGHKLIVHALRKKKPRKMKKRLLRESYGGEWGDIKNRSFFRVRS